VPVGGRGTALLGFAVAGAGHCTGNDPDRNEQMQPDTWPRRPPPETTEPRYEHELSRPADLRTVRAELRTWVRGVLDGTDEDGSVLDTLLLTVDELASNGLRHGAVPVCVRAARTPGGLLLDVSDDDPDHGPEPAVGRDPALGGMGLHMVARLSGERGWTVAGGRKHIWACLHTP
jgi:anti-sigma regulatory factor (Ser/Thr protein kinase)